MEPKFFWIPDGDHMGNFFNRICFGNEGQQDTAVYIATCRYSEDAEKFCVLFNAMLKSKPDEVWEILENYN